MCRAPYRIFAGTTGNLLRQIPGFPFEDIYGEYSMARRSAQRTESAQASHFRRRGHVSPLLKTKPVPKKPKIPKILPGWGEERGERSAKGLGKSGLDRRLARASALS
jgi:hypothetical protein